MSSHTRIQMTPRIETVKESGQEILGLTKLLGTQGTGIFLKTLNDLAQNNTNRVDFTEYLNESYGIDADSSLVDQLAWKHARREHGREYYELTLKGSALEACGQPNESPIPGNEPCVTFRVEAGTSMASLRFDCASRIEIQAGQEVNAVTRQRLFKAAQPIAHRVFNQTLAVAVSNHCAQQIHERLREKQRLEVRQRAVLQTKQKVQQFNMRCYAETRGAGGWQ